MCVIVIQLLPKTPMLKTLATFQIIQSRRNFENLPSKYRKNRCKDILKPEMQREWTHLLYKCKVKNTLSGNKRPTTPQELNRATTSLICEKSCPLTCAHNFILVPPPSTPFSLYSHALFNKNQDLPRTRPMPTLFVSILLVYYYLERSAWNMCIMKLTLNFQN